MLISFQLALEDRGRLLGVGGVTINWLRNKHSCREILVRGNNKLTIDNDDNQIINNIIVDIELSQKKIMCTIQPKTTNHKNKYKNEDPF